MSSVKRVISDADADAADRDEAMLLRLALVGSACHVGITPISRLFLRAS